MNSESTHIKWLNSKEARKTLKISTCDFDYLLEIGELLFKKKGNAFYVIKKQLYYFEVSKKQT